MARQSPSLPAVADPIGGFTAEALELHLATQANAPAFWLEKKRAAYARFASLPLPGRKDEAWRFSSVSGVTLGGFAPAPASARSRPAGLGVEAAASLVFVDGRAAAADALPADLIQWGRKVVAQGPDDLHLDLQARMAGPEGLRHQVGLAQGQR